ncbi:MAG TPA: S9 family peptidase [Sphingobium sp.]
MRYFTACIAVAGLAMQNPANAEATEAKPADDAAIFGARENIEQISLSPDGAQVAFLSPTSGQGSSLFVASVTGGKPPVPISGADGNPEQMSQCNWVSIRRLICTVRMLTNTDAGIIGYSRLFAIDQDGGNVKMVSNRTTVRTVGYAQYGGRIVDLSGQDGAALIARDYVPEEQIGTKLANTKDGLGVDLVDTLTLNARHVESPKRTAVEYISDGRGNVRIMGLMPPATSYGYAGNIIRYSYRTKTGKDWQDLGSLDVANDRGFNPYAVDPTLDAVYGLEDSGGRKAAYRIALDGSARKELVFAHPQVDVDGFIRIGRERRVVGATFATDKRTAVYFDPGLKALAASLSKALPNAPLVNFMDSSVDERKLLLWAGSDIDPGRYYVFDRDKKALSEILLARPQLEGRTLAPMKSVSYRAADGAQIPGYLSVPPGSEGKRIPAIVMPHGGPGARDEWGFDWLVQFFVARGYAVLQPNFRGSAGYGEAWFEKNGFQSWRTAIGDVNDGGRWLVSQGIADPAKLAVLGWSYGGYAALQSAILDPDLFKAIVAVAPVTDLAGLRDQSRNFSNFLMVDQFVGNGPHIREGSPALNAARIKAPVLMFHGDHDVNVNILQSRLMADRLRDAGKQGQLVVYPKLDHQLSDSAARADMLRKSDAFLRTALGIGK